MKYRKLNGYKYELIEKESIEVPELSKRSVNTRMFSLDGGVLIIAKGYCWDGASGPTIDTAGVMRAALAHDAIYQMLRSGHLKRTDRKTADQILRRIMLGDTPTRWGRIRAGYYYWSVRLVGGRAARSHIEPQNRVHEA